MSFVAVTLAMICLSSQAALAETPDVEKDPRALAALERLGVYLRTLKHLRLEAYTESDQTLTNGQVVQFEFKTELLATLPDKLRVTVIDGPYRKTLFYNGQKFALFDAGQRYYATGAAPPTIDGFLAEMSERYGVVLPLADLFRWSATTAKEVGISSALYLNDQEIDGRLCAHYAYRQPGVDWQLWVHLGSQPLPCQLVIVRQDVESLPRHRVRYSWVNEKPAPVGAYEFVPPKGVRSVPLRELVPSLEGSKQ
jgi:hypothetical protein